MPPSPLFVVVQEVFYSLLSFVATLAVIFRVGATSEHDCFERVKREFVKAAKMVQVTGDPCANVKRLSDKDKAIVEECKVRVKTALESIATPHDMSNLSEEHRVLVECFGDAYTEALRIVMGVEDSERPCDQPTLWQQEEDLLTAGQASFRVS